MRTCVSVDVEDYFSLVVRDQMGLTVPVSPQVEGQTTAVLDLLDEIGVRATCFVVGYVARAYPGLVRQIVRRGHEVASHGFRHLAMPYLSPEAFERDLRESINVLTDITGTPVRGFRAPAFSLLPQHRWAFPIMAAAGLTYDSSVRMIWPTGMPHAKALIEAAAAAGIIEIPGVAIGLGPWAVPLGGGGGLRVLPIALSRWGLSMASKGGLIPLYVHSYDTGKWPVYPWPRRPFVGRLRVTAFNVLQRLGRGRVAQGLRELIATSRVERPGRALLGSSHGDEIAATHAGRGGVEN